MRLRFFHIFLFAFTFVLFSCKPDNSASTNVELITTLKLNFKNSGKVYQYKILNSKVTVDTIYISKNTTDTFNVSVFDESKTPAIDLTSDINMKKNDHQFFYTSSASLNLSTRYLDRDAKDYPIGLMMEISVSNISNGNLNIILKHQPDIKDGSVNTGATDVNVTFPVKII